MECSSIGEHLAEIPGAIIYGGKTGINNVIDMAEGGVNFLGGLRTGSEYLTPEQTEASRASLDSFGGGMPKTRRDLSLEHSRRTGYIHAAFTEYFDTRHCRA